MKKYIFEEDDWINFKQIYNFLRPFKEVTDIMSSSTYPTLSTVVPLYNTLIDHIEDTANMKDTELVIMKAANSYKDKLTEYYNKTNETYLIATILDSRLKLEYYKDNNWEDKMINDINRMQV